MLLVLVVVLHWLLVLLVLLVLPVLLVLASSQASSWNDQPKVLSASPCEHIRNGKRTSAHHICHGRGNRRA